MKSFKFLFVTAIFLACISCDKDETNPNKIEATGVLQKQGVTTYQYGTHTLSEYALRSGSIDLDNYVNQRVTVVGQKIDGYPVDGGPDYLEVEQVK